MTNKLTVQTKVVYGENMYYPVNEVAQCIANLLRTKTISTWALKQCDSVLGMELEVLPVADKNFS